MKRKTFYAIIISASLILVFVGGKTLIISDVSSGDVLLVQQGDVVPVKADTSFAGKSTVGLINPEFHIDIILWISLLAAVSYLVLKETFVRERPVRGPPCTVKI